MTNPHRNDVDAIAGGPWLRRFIRPDAGALEGCPIEGPDAHYLFFASNRANGYGGNDIWAAYRESVEEDFLVPHVLPGSLQPPGSVNSSANDFCPTPLTGGRLMFVSTRASDQCGTAGVANIYETRLDPALGWLEPHVLPCDGPDSINSAWDEFSPSLVEAEGRTVLFFSSGRDGAHKIYMSERQPDGQWGPATPVAELNSAAQDARPNVSDDGLEIVFDSTRQGGNPDIWTARRTSISKPWSAPVRLGRTSIPTQPRRAHPCRETAGGCISGRTATEPAKSMSPCDRCQTGSDAGHLS